MFRVICSDVSGHGNEGREMFCEEVKALVVALYTWARDRSTAYERIARVLLGGALGVLSVEFLVGTAPEGDDDMKRRFVSILLAAAEEHGEAVPEYVRQALQECGYGELIPPTHDDFYLMIDGESTIRLSLRLDENGNPLPHSVCGALSEVMQSGRLALVRASEPVTSVE